MAPKHKAKNLPKDAKLVKKRYQIKMEDSSSFKEDDKKENNIKGKIYSVDNDQKKYVQL
jgi:hypothetical protein